MSREANYHEFNTVPAWTRPQWNGDGEVLNETDPYKWSGSNDPPAIGARIKCSMNKLGAGTVIGYFAEYGWLGVLVQLDKNPKWRREQLKGNPPAHLFGIDLEPRKRKAA